MLSNRVWVVLLIMEQLMEVNLSVSDGAFVFDGSGDYIESGLTISHALREPLNIRFHYGLNHPRGIWMIQIIITYVSGEIQQLKTVGLDSLSWVVNYYMHIMHPENIQVTFFLQLVIGITSLLS